MCISVVPIVCVILLEIWKYSVPLSIVPLGGGFGGVFSLCSERRWNGHSWFCRAGTAAPRSCVVHGTAKCDGCSPSIRHELQAGWFWCCCSSVWQTAGYQLLLWHKAIPRAKSLSFKRDAFTLRAMFVIYSVTSPLPLPLQSSLLLKTQCHW